MDRAREQSAYVPRSRGDAGGSRCLLPLCVGGRRRRGPAAVSTETFWSGVGSTARTGDVTRASKFRASAGLSPTRSTVPWWSGPSGLPLTWPHGSSI